MRRTSARDVVNAVKADLHYTFSNPFYTCMDVSAYCNFSCEGCNYPDLQKNNVLEQPSLETLIRRTVTLGKTFGSQILNFADGEPTMNSGLAKLIQAASQKHIVAITTNGTLITPEKAIQYWNAGMQFAAVSLCSLNNERYQKAIGTEHYEVEDVQNAIETLIRTGPGDRILKRVSIAVTIDNLTTSQELEELARYAQDVGAIFSPQLYSHHKKFYRTSVSPDDPDPREIVPETFKAKFDGSLARFISGLQNRYKVFFLRGAVLTDFDTYVDEGQIPWKPGRILTIRLDGAVKLEPEGEPIINIDSANSREVKNAVWKTVYDLRAKGETYAESCYRCLTATTPSTPFGDWFVNILTCLRLERAVRFA